MRALLACLAALLIFPHEAYGYCSPYALCLNKQRFQVTLTARDQRTGHPADGYPDQKTDVFGFFSLAELTFDSRNPEVFVKILGPVNGAYWVFYGGLTDFEYTLKVVDVQTGATKSYIKEAGSACGGFDVGAFVDVVTPNQVASPSAMTERRFGHTATLLPDGRVLITGGSSGASTFSKTAELFDPRTGTFTRTGDMLEARFGHNSTLLPNGRVLITGGYRGGYLKSAEFYDVATGTFSLAGQMTQARSSHTVTILRDGTLLIAGGAFNTSATRTAEIYDPPSNHFTAVGNMTDSRDSHSATLLPSGEVLIAGGQQVSSFGTVANQTAELYDPPSRTFSETHTMLMPRSAAASILLSTGDVLIVGGFACLRSSCVTDYPETYNRTNAAFTVGHSMNDPRASFTASPLPNGRVLVVGGARNFPSNNATSETYDPATKQFTRGATMKSARSSHTATVLRSGDILITGGQDGETGALASAELYDVRTGTFR